jgi:hypothetical protein
VYHHLTEFLYKAPLFTSRQAISDAVAFGLLVLDVLVLLTGWIMELREHHQHLAHAHDSEADGSTHHHHAHDTDAAGSPRQHHRHEAEAAGNPGSPTPDPPAPLLEPLSPPHMPEEDEDEGEGEGKQDGPGSETGAEEGLTEDDDMPLVTPDAGGKPRGMGWRAAAVELPLSFVHALCPLPVVFFDYQRLVEQELSSRVSPRAINSMLAVIYAVTYASFFALLWSALMHTTTEVSLVGFTP